MSNQNLKKQNSFKNKRNEFTSFQSDIVIDEDGEIHISFFGPELLHLLDRKVEFDCNRFWTLPEYSPLHFDKILTEIKAEYENCSLCPKQCGFDRTKNAHMNCGDWELRVSNFGISFGDEIEISNGGGSGVIFLNGCPLTCPSCINQEKVRDSKGNTSIIEFLKMCETLYLRGANNIQILSPSVSFPHLRVILKTLKDLNFPLPIVLKSSGYESLAELKKLRGLVDVYLPDYKFSSSQFWQKESGAEQYHHIFLECIEEMHQQTGQVIFNDKKVLIKGVMIRHVLNPFIDQKEKITIANFLNSFQKGIRVSILDNFVVLE